MHRVALAFSYDGTRFDSFARQPGRRTIEGELLAALKASGALEDAAAQRFATGSRTDAGVSAAMNVCAFDTRLAPRRIVARTVTPAGLWLLAATTVPQDFNPRHARRRTYAYVLDPRIEFDARAMRQALRRFQGRHDMTNFSRPEPGRSPLRRVDRVGLRRLHGAWIVSVTGPNFAWQQVRRMVWAALGVAQGRYPLARLLEALDHPQRRIDLGTAPPEGLILRDVRYAFSFPAPTASVRKRLQQEAWHEHVQAVRADAWRRLSF
jgi:tRNA pseudouridine38-40 synthase